MILGRNAGLWAALVAAAINVAVLVFGLPLSTEQVVALNVFGLAVIGLIANEADPTSAGTFDATLRPPTPAQLAAKAAAHDQAPADVPPATGDGGGADPNIPPPL